MERTTYLNTEEENMKKKTYLIFVTEWKCVYTCVCVCVCERERENVCVCVRERACDCEEILHM